VAPAAARRVCGRATCHPQEAALGASRCRPPCQLHQQAQQAQRFS
jgi:hypothetical protein